MLENIKKTSTEDIERWSCEDILLHVLEITVYIWRFWSRVHHRVDMLIDSDQMIEVQEGVYRHPNHPRCL